MSVPNFVEEGREEPWVGCSLLSLLKLGQSQLCCAAAVKPGDFLVCS